MSKYNQSDLTIANIYSWFHSNLNVPQARKKKGGGLSIDLFPKYKWPLIHLSIDLFTKHLLGTCSMSWTLRLQRQKKGLRKVDCLSQWLGKNSDPRLSNSRNLKWFFQSAKLKSNYRDRWTKINAMETWFIALQSHRIRKTWQKSPVQSILINESSLLLKQHVYL